MLDISIAGGTSRNQCSQCLTSIQKFYTLTSFTCGDITAIRHSGQLADPPNNPIQDSAQHSAICGGTVSTFPASANEINSTPSSRIREPGMLASNKQDYDTEVMKSEREAHNTNSNGTGL